MSAFKKIGPAIGALSAAVSPAGGAGVLRGDVRLFPLGVDPGAGWLAETQAVPYDPRFDGLIPPSISTNLPWIEENGGPAMAQRVVEYADGRFIHAGGSGFTNPSYTNFLTVSNADGVWEPKALPLPNPVHSYARALAGLHVFGLADSQVLLTPDFDTFTVFSLSGSLARHCLSIGVNRDNGTMLVGASSATIWRLNADATTSVSRPTPYVNQSGFPDAAFMEWGNGIHLTAGSGQMHSTANNAESWVNRSGSFPNSDTSQVTALRFVPHLGLFLAARGPRLYTSPDGAIWTLRHTLAAGFIRDFSSDGTYVVAVTSNGTTIASLDIAEWGEERPYPGPSGSSILRIACANGGMVVGGGNTGKVYRGRVPYSGFPVPRNKRPANLKDHIAYTRIAA